MKSLHQNTSAHRGNRIRPQKDREERQKAVKCELSKKERKIWMLMTDTCRYYQFTPAKLPIVIQQPKGPFKAKKWHPPQKSLSQSLTYAELSTSSPKTKAFDTVSYLSPPISFFLNFEYSLYCSLFHHFHLTDTGTQMKRSSFRFVLVNDTR